MALGAHGEEGVRGLGRHGRKRETREGAPRMPYMASGGGLRSGQGEFSGRVGAFHGGVMGHGAQSHAGLHGKMGKRDGVMATTTPTKPERERRS
ncbi:hypothetical protein E2562_033650 [Oryza meyeriana var. granulata]|uniref:Uncharacterized protein n=1 Tax=Oryza meyeriana var. granulata TaxID=110450 RepID=A0A6G1CA71_9ORYZ|nr:hypothetical protein E2562_033650 [Oryza meyeriana var. granulata]